MKQIAVEWLESELNELSSMGLSIGQYSSVRKNIFEQAKELEKMQHQETFYQARLAKNYEKDMTPVWDSWYQYYNITFKSE